MRPEPLTQLLTIETGLHPLVEAVVEAAPDALLVVDGRGRIRLTNARAEQMFDYKRDELLGESIELLLPPRFRSSHAQLRAEYTAAPVTRPMGSGLALSGLRKDGREFPAEISLSPLEVIGDTLTIAIIRDVTE